jgi:hypothetical protein
VLIGLSGKSNEKCLILRHETDSKYPMDISEYIFIVYWKFPGDKLQISRDIEAYIHTKSFEMEINVYAH